MSETVYVNDNPIGETQVFHSRKGHVTTLRRWRDRYIREMTVAEAREEGLRPCKVCFSPSEQSEYCPACGQPGGGDDVLAEGQRWCNNDGCRVVSFHEEVGDV